MKQRPSEASANSTGGWANAPPDNSGINLLKYTAIALILITGSWFASQQYTRHQQKMLFTEINVPKGQRVNMTLADGTSVWLSPRSKIRIPNEFQGNNRTVELDGEGYFSVTKDPKRPFIVKTQQFNVEVLGTEFNVFAYTEIPRFETNLVEGSVLVYNKDNKVDYSNSGNGSTSCPIMYAI
mgnify:CR=1 FL=1